MVGVAGRCAVLAGDAGVAFALALNQHAAFIEDRFAAVFVHAHVALFGWVGLVMIAVAGHLQPMFLVAHGVSRRAASVAVWAIVSGVALAVLPLGKLADGAGLALMALGVLAFLLQSTLHYQARHKRRLGPGLVLAAAGLCALALALVLAPYAAWTGLLAPRWLSTYVLLVVGGISLFVAGDYYKIIPFLVWFHRYSALVGERPVPNVADLYSERVARISRWSRCPFGLVGIAAGMLVGSAPGVRAAALVFTAGAIDRVGPAGCRRGQERSMTTPVSVDEIYEALGRVIDPELGVDIVTLEQYVTGQRRQRQRRIAVDGGGAAGCGPDEVDVRCRGQQNYGAERRNGSRYFEHQQPSEVAGRGWVVRHSWQHRRTQPGDGEWATGDHSTGQRVRGADRGSSGDDARLVVDAVDASGNSRHSEYDVDLSANAAQYRYDPAGNLVEKTEDATWTYEWNGLGQLVRLRRDGVQAAAFEYDALGRRISKVTPAGRYEYTYDWLDVIRERGPSGVRLYVHGPWIDEPLAEVQPSGIAAIHHADGLGSIIATTDASGAVTSRRQYDAWGNLEVGADQPGYAFTGREWDPETGLYYYRARYYDPKAGRFISEDPIGLAGGTNLYTYVDNNPANTQTLMGCRLLLVGSWRSSTR